MFARLCAVGWFSRWGRLSFAGLLGLAALAAEAAAQQPTSLSSTDLSAIGPARYASHPPLRPLPRPAATPKSTGPARYVDPLRGSDENPGTEQRPYRTLAHAVKQLTPGETLYLRGGTYYEHVTVSAQGTADQPITIAGYPGELAIIDGGLREFFEQPEQAWEPVAGGAPGEFRSTRTYPDLGGTPDGVNVLGNFGDSMVPLQGYRLLGDLRSDNPYWNVNNKVGSNDFVYCGPGIYYDVETGRIHCRLAHTRLNALGELNYRGETDPRRIPLVIAGFAGGSPLRLRNAQWVRLQDLVLRGAREATLAIEGCRHIELVGLTIYGGSAAVNVRDTWGLRVLDTACRGLAAPWTFRGALKYRSIEARIFSASRWEPTGQDNRDLEIAYSEFTDCVDGVFLGNVRRVRFHHNLVDNISDDGIFLTAQTAYDGTMHGGDVQIYQNLFARCLTTFAFGVGHGRQRITAKGVQTGAGVDIFRNVFDFRGPVMYHWPSGPDDDEQLRSLGRFAGDHGSPAWEPMRIYHNTILAGDPPRYDYGTDGLGRAVVPGTSRRVFNNIICQKLGMIGQTLPDPTKADYIADANLFWSLTDGPTFQGEIFSRFRRSIAFEQSKQSYAPGWTVHDQFADPQFVKLSPHWRTPPDLRLQETSPAVNRGIYLPSDWPDPMRAADEGIPDVGALPLGSEVWRVAVGGRLNAFGQEMDAAADQDTRPPVPWEFATQEYPAPKTQIRALVYQGYPAFDAPLAAFALRRAGAQVEVLERTWLEPEQFKQYDVIVIDGSFARAKIEPNRFSVDDLKHVEAFLKQGGTLILMRERLDLFATPEGRAFLASHVGNAAAVAKSSADYRLLKPKHPWIAHLKVRPVLPWLGDKLVSPLRASQGEPIIGTADGAAALYRVPVGKGQLIYIGWSIARSLPSGRDKGVTVEQEQTFDDQMQVLLKMAHKVVKADAQQESLDP
mgnify:CR=1 FL=1